MFELSCAESKESSMGGIQTPEDKLLALSEEMNDKRDKRVAQSGEQFNVFSVLNMMTNEVNCHSRFLHELLSPSGSHGMKATFLALFFEKVLGISPEPWLASTTVEREYPFGDGRIDLLIKKPGECCIVIEVKIYASDQYRQIARYYDFIEREHSADLLKGVYYLTLDGHDPEESSVGETGAEYTCLSFRTDIIPWLAACAEEAREKPRLYEVIKQYIDILNDLTGEAGMDEEMRYVTNAVAASSINYKAAAQIANALPKARTSLLRKIFSDLRAHLDAKLPGCDLTTSAEQEDIERYYVRSGREKPWPRLRFQLKRDGDYILALTVEVEDRLYIGINFFIYDNSRFGFKKIDVNDARDWLYHLAETDAWHRKVESAPGGDWWIDWQYLDSGSGDANDEALIDFRHCSKGYEALYDKEKYDERLSEWKGRIYAYLKKIEDELGVTFRTP